jgi:sugar lactone lactonase YvrE
MTAKAKTRRSARARRVLIVVIVVLLILLLSTFVFLASIIRPAGFGAAEEAADAGNLEWVRSIYGYGNTEEEQLNAPNDVAIGPDGTIWVTDQARARVLGFNPDGSFSTLLHRGPRGSSPEALAFPASLAVDEDGLVYIGDFLKDRVIVMTPENEIDREYIVPTPTSVAVRGDTIVVGSGAGFVILNQAGEVINLVGTKGTGDEQFDTVRGVAIAEDGTIFAVDQYNNRVSAYSSDGTRLWIQATGLAGNQSEMAMGQRSFETTAEAGLILPARVAIDGAGRLAIVDPFDFSITLLDSADGSLIGKHGQYGVTDGQFTYPTGISYDPDRDWFAIADTGNSRVQIVRLADSGGTGGAVVNRALASGWAACIWPILLLLLLLLALVVRRRVRRKREGAEALELEAAEATL